MAKGESRAILEAYKRVAEASWPEMHPRMRERAPRWAGASEDDLRAELDGYIAEASRPESNVRVFWKLGPDFTFSGCNEQFAQDAGMRREDLIGTTDFDRRLPWKMQAAKYRADDQRVFDSRTADLDIVERQQSATGSITWVRAGKAPILAPDGTALGVLGMYELLDAERGPQLYAQRRQKKS
ncbi:MAG TPA: PAS domain-containing protein [Gemmatimonadaceae bacterium]|nr:PAS domain-containing protein [Gemmatimonadaceae bacterium]